MQLFYIFILKNYLGTVVSNVQLNGKNYFYEINNFFFFWTLEIWVLCDELHLAVIWLSNDCLSKIASQRELFMKEKLFFILKFSRSNKYHQTVLLSIEDKNSS